MGWNEPGSDKDKDKNKWSGKDEPPDLDEALKNFQNKIKRTLMGGKSAKPNGTGRDARHICEGEVSNAVGAATQRHVCRWGSPCDQYGAPCQCSGQGPAGGRHACVLLLFASAGSLLCVPHGCPSPIAGRLSSGTNSNSASSQRS